MVDIKTSVNEYVEYVKDLLVKVDKYANIISFKQIDFDFLDENLCINQLKQNNGIYFITIENLDEVGNEEICKKINDYKNLKTYKYPKVNSNNCFQGNNVLYVGKSKGILKTRLQGHLGNGSKSTYALHLGQWKNDETLKKVKLKLHYAFVDLDNDHIESEILEMLETALHRKYKPILGRTGH